VLHDIPNQIPEEEDEAVAALEQWSEERALLEKQSEDGALMQRRVADVPRRGWSHGIGACIGVAWNPSGGSISWLEPSAPSTMATALGEANPRLRG
jgi:hypothetical protein